MEHSTKIHCETSGKLLARRDEKGIYLWCKECKTEHFVPWDTEDSKEKNSGKVASEAVL